MTQLLQTNAFARDFSKLPPKVQISITAYLIRLRDDPKSLDIKHLKGMDHCYRLRCGDYRVIFGKIMGGIELLKVAHRKDIYR